MKVLLSVACLIGFSAFADDVITAQSLEVKERLATFEQIDVTAQKDIDPATEVDVDADVAAILEAAETDIEK